MSLPLDLTIPAKLPLLALGGEVLFPGCDIRMTITSANTKNFELVKSRLLTDFDSTSPERSPGGNGSKQPIIGLVPGGLPTGDASLKDATSMSLFGTAAVVNQVTAVGWPNPTFTITLSGLCRICIEKLVMEVPYPVAMVTVPADSEKYIGTPELKEAAATFRALVLMLLNSLPTDNGPTFYIANMKRILVNASNLELPDLFAASLGIGHTEKLELLGTFDLLERYKVVTDVVTRQTKAMHSSPVEQGPPRPRGMYVLRMVPRDGMVAGGSRLRHPLHAPRPDDLDGDSVQELLNKLKAAQLPPHAMKVATKDLQRMKRLSPSNAELPMLRSYLELMSELPWAKSSSETLDVAKAREDLDTDHYAMEKLKKRVLEYLAVRQLKNSLRGPILCFVGPPGVGKTSIGRSIANTLNREFHRISLGGVCNQSDIRGHRRTYIGAMPGRIIQGLKTVGVNNPIFLLDEVDKLRAGIQGDPGAALLEVLDPGQNHTFHDHYLNVPFDLSQVMFIATANSTKDIPRALLDRMEVIEVDGYTHEEKFHIAVRHLIPKQVSQHGLTEREIRLPAETVKMLVKDYTQEAGVRSLERRLGAVCRAVAVRVAARRRGGGDDANVEPITIDCQRLEKILGPAPYSDTQLHSRLGQPGVAMGLSTSLGGGNVLLVEASKMEGDGELQLTGQLGSVMKESANLALSYLRTSAYKYGLNLDSETLSRTDIHVHFPAGAIAKEGPSAGVALVTVLLSLFSNRPVATDVAMTGEISLKGAVLPVGGVKAKVLAAHRMGIRRVILPDKNAQELRKISQEIKDELTFILVSHVDEVIQAAFVGGYPTNPEDAQPIISKL